MFYYNEPFDMETLNSYLSREESVQYNVAEFLRKECLKRYCKEKIVPVLWGTK